MNQDPREMDNCICSEWDGKGWSTCWLPMPRTHNRRQDAKTDYRH